MQQSEDLVEKIRRQNKERKAKWLAKQSEEKLAKIRAGNAISQQRLRGRLTEEQAAARRAANAESQRRHRERLTAEQAAACRAANAAAHRLSKQRLNQAVGNENINCVETQEVLPFVQVEYHDETTNNVSAPDGPGAFNNFDTQEIKIKRSNSTDELNNTGELDNGTDPLEDDKHFGKRNENNIYFTEHEAFVRSIATQISNLPLHESLKLRQKIQTLVNEECFKYFEENQASSSQVTKCEDDLSANFDTSFVKVENFNEYYDTKDNFIIK